MSLSWQALEYSEGYCINFLICILCSTDGYHTVWYSTHCVLILKSIISGRAHSLGRNQGFRRHRFLSRPRWKNLPDKIQMNISQSPVHWNLGPMMAKVIRGNLWWWSFSTLKEMVGLHPLFILFCFLVWRWVPWSTIHSLTLPSDSPSKAMKEMHWPGHGPESLKWWTKIKPSSFFLTVLSRVFFFFFCSDGCKHTGSKLV